MQQIDYKRYQEEPEALGIDPHQLDELVNRARQEVDSGLLPSAQIAVARHGKLAHVETFGDADKESLYPIFSATKGITSAAAWLLIQAESLDVTRKVADVIPEFGANDKADITIEQVFLHTGGFPHAPFRVEDWPDKARRYQRFADWRLNWQPGSRYEYHPTSSMWIIAELIERISGQTYDQFVTDQIASPLGLSDLRVGTPPSEHDRIVDVHIVGEPLTAEDYAEMGLPVPPVTEVTPEAILKFNEPANRTIPIPGGGGIMSAADLALFYQALIGHSANGVNPWETETLEFVTQPRTGDLKDQVTGAPTNRALGVVIAGDKQRNLRGFGHTNSPATFGHNGAGGQVAWVDPATGISFVYVTNGHDQNRVREARRGISISNRAAVCANP